MSEDWQKERKQKSKNIPAKTKFILWGKSGGRCHLCNKIVWKDDFTQSELNLGEAAHIIASSDKGPRGDLELSEKLEIDISNLMLMCRNHHKLIDTKEYVEKYPNDYLFGMKALHEERIEIATGIKHDQKSTVILYGANISEQSTPISYDAAIQAMFPDRYPTGLSPINIHLTGSAMKDKDECYWDIEKKNLDRKFLELLKPKIESKEVSHLSIFGLAPIPLLAYLGHLLTDKVPADVFQLHISLSGKIQPVDVNKKFDCGDDYWELTIPEPNNDCIKSRRQLSEFRQIFRRALDKIKSNHGPDAIIQILPAIPASTSIEIGRVWMPKADLPMKIWDRNREDLSFNEAIQIG